MQTGYTLGEHGMPEPEELQKGGSKMKDIESIMEDYRGSDSERRLYLFLDCPSLRNEFIKIDQSVTTPEHRAQQKTDSGLKRPGVRSVFATLRHAWSFKSG